MIYSTSSLVGSSTTSGGALVGTFLSGSVWSNRNQLTHMEYGVSLNRAGRLSLQATFPIRFSTRSSLLSSSFRPGQACGLLKQVGLGLVDLLELSPRRVVAPFIRLAASSKLSRFGLGCCAPATSWQSRLMGKPPPVAMVWGLRGAPWPTRREEAEVRRRAFWLLSYSSTEQHPAAPVLLVCTKVP